MEEDRSKEHFKVPKDGIEGNQNSSLITGPMKDRINLQNERKGVSNERSILFMEGSPTNKISDIEGVENPGKVMNFC